MKFNLRLNAATLSCALMSSMAQAQDISAMQVAVDDQFAQWSSTWGVDRYVPGSSRIEGKQCKDKRCTVWGKFTFTRFGAPHSIAFSATIDHSQSLRLSVARLCYDDNTTGMRDCVDGSSSQAASERAQPDSQESSTRLTPNYRHDDSADQEEEEAEQNRQREATAQNMIIIKREEERRREEQREAEAQEQQREQAEAAEAEAARIREDAYLQQQNERLREGPDY